MLSDITNYVQLTDMVGTSGQPSEEQFREIAEAGFVTVINLAMPDSDDAISNEGQIVTSHGMNYIHIPVPFESPLPSHARQFINVLAALEKEKTWVHCQVNARVSAFMYHYLTKHKGLSEAESRSPILEKWEPRMDDVWRGFLALSAEDIAEGG